MELKITAFKGSPWLNHNTHEVVIEVRGRNANPDALLGAHLVWRTQTGRVVRGKVVKRHGHDHGNKVLARFHKGLPGQALGQLVHVRASHAAPTAATEARAAKRGAKPGTAKAAAPKAAPKAGAKGLKVTGAVFDAPGAEASHLEEEWVRITNDSDAPADLTGWTLKDKADHTFAFPAGFTLAPGASVKVRTGKGAHSGHDLYWGRAAAVWNNTGDTAFLSDAKGKVVSAYTWKGPPKRAAAKGAATKGTAPKGGAKPPAKGGKKA
ncbi:MAG TPA: lamin tail domain-containing protein [Candidatus Thermoplasmatota archaeon]|jgi:ribosomal protein L35AE/L33A|nr:lamin tail domain-containing protein [Candidatus Thermoplasmatota archaeon]